VPIGAFVDREQRDELVRLARCAFCTETSTLKRTTRPGQAAVQLGFCSGDIPEHSPKRLSPDRHLLRPALPVAASHVEGAQRLSARPDIAHRSECESHPTWFQPPRLASSVDRGTSSRPEGGRRSTRQDHDASICPAQTLSQPSSAAHPKRAEAGHRPFVHVWLDGISVDRAAFDRQPASGSEASVTELLERLRILEKNLTHISL
jgi:hypothetical protein